MTVIGIDIGGSTTKIVGRNGNNLLPPMRVKANDPITALYGAFGKYLSENFLSLSDISEIRLTGVGASFVSDNIFNIPTRRNDEFRSIGRGGLYLSKLEKALIVSMGTGTAFVYADKNTIRHVGGTGVGGGTLLGLSSKLIGVKNFESICELAKDGDLSKVDLSVGDISKTDPGVLKNETTASNFGGISDYANNNDIAIGLVNMVFQTIGMMAYFASKTVGINDIVLCGNLTLFPEADKFFKVIHDLYDVNFIMPENSEFATVFGSALLS